MSLNRADMKVSAGMVPLEVWGTGTNLAAEDTTILRQEQATDRIFLLSEY